MHHQFRTMRRKRRHPVIESILSAWLELRSMRKKY